MVGKPGRSGRKSIGGQALTGRERQRRYLRHKWEATADPWMGELLPKEDLMLRLDEFSRLIGVGAWRRLRAERQRSHLPASLTAA